MVLLGFGWLKRCSEELEDDSFSGQDFWGEFSESCSYVSKNLV